MNVRRIALLAGLAVAVALLVLAVLWNPTPLAPAGPSTDISVVIVAVDGLDWFLVGKYIEEGRMPTLGRLAGRSLTGQIAADRPVVPEVGWTRLVRGRPLSDGEIDLVQTREDGRLVAVEPEIARLVTEAGGRALTVGWPGTWPAATSAGTVVAPYAPFASEHHTALAPALLEGAPRQVFPEDLAPRVWAAAAGNGETYAAGFAERILASEGPIAPDWRDHVAAARWSYLADSIVLDVAAGLLAEEEPDLALICFGGLDAIGHRFTAATMRDQLPNLPESFAVYEDVLPNYHTFLDEALGRLLRIVDQRTVIIVCSVYGTHPYFDVPRFSGSHREGPPGVLIARGPGFQRSPTPLELSTLDLAPTILALLGLPVPSWMDGRVVTGLLPAGHLEAFPLVYEPARAPALEAGPPSGTEALDALVRERLDGVRAGLVE